jgi:hypothetical protein
MQPLTILHEQRRPLPKTAKCSFVPLWRYLQQKYFCCDVPIVTGTKLRTMQRSVAVLLAAAAGATIGMPRASAFQGALASLRIPIFGKNQPKSEGWISHVPSLPFRPTHLRLKGGLSSGISSAMTATSTTEISAPVEKFRKDYKVPDYSIVNVELTFKIFKGQTQVHSTSECSSESANSSGREVNRFDTIFNTIKLYFRRFFHPSR